MSSDGAGFTQGQRRAILAGLCSILLASCSSTSDPSVQLGLASGNATVVDSSSLYSASSDSTSATPSTSASGETATAALTGAPVPSPRPGADATEAPAQQVAAATAAEPAVEEETSDQTAVAADAAQGGKEAAEDPKPIQQATAEPEATTAATASTDDASVENVAEAAVEPKKRGFLSSFFSPAQAKPNAAVKAIKQKQAVAASEQNRGDRVTQPETQTQPQTQAIVDTKSDAKPIITLASAKAEGAQTARASFSGDALPGVRQGGGLFEITSKSGIDDDADVDVYEDVGTYQVASAAGLARLAPNGLLKQRDDVDVSCLKPALVRVLRTIESHYGKKVMVTSGYRDPGHNKRVRGARKSLHMYCAAADIQVEGISKWELAKFTRSMPGRGGVGTYCHTNSVHVDVGPERDWNWRCRRRK